MDEPPIICTWSAIATKNNLGTHHLRVEVLLTYVRFAPRIGWYETRARLSKTWSQTVWALTMSETWLPALWKLSVYTKTRNPRCVSNAHPLSYVEVILIRRCMSKRIQEIRWTFVHQRRDPKTYTKSPAMETLVAYAHMLVAMELAATEPPPPDKRYCSTFGQNRRQQEIFMP